jgi:putative oxidoreductase
MKVLVLVARILLGLVFFVFGLNKIITFMHMPMPVGDAGDLMGLMFRHHWLNFYGFIEASAGLMLLVGRFVPLGLTLLAGVGLNILLFHVTLEQSALPLPLFLALLEVLLVYAYRASFAGIFAAKADASLS